MPFTAAHPAIILPLLRRRWLSATALVIGSLTPDFEYFFRLKTQSHISHTLPGLLVFNLPVALLLSILFHTVVRDQAIQYLPPYFKRRALAISYPDNWLQYLRQNWLAVCLGAVVGAFSHLLWDSFTHKGLFFVDQFPALAETFTLPLLGKTVPMYRVIQHVSTLVGLAFILGYIHKLPKAPLRDEQENSWPWFWLLTSTTAFLFLLFNILVRKHLEKLPGHMIVTLISGWILSLFLLSLINKLLQQLTTKKG